MYSLPNAYVFYFFLDLKREKYDTKELASDEHLSEVPLVHYWISDFVDIVRLSALSVKTEH